jgi:hypothetical protein
VGEAMAGDLVDEDYLSVFISHMQVFEGWPDRVFVKNTKRQLVYLNGAGLAAKGNGMALVDVLGKTDEDFFAPAHAEDAARIETAMLEEAYKGNPHDLSWRLGKTAS